MLGADRLDYSKGIPERLRAFRNALAAWNGDDGSAALARHYLGLIGEIR